MESIELQKKIQHKFDKYLKDDMIFVFFLPSCPYSISTFKLLDDHALKYRKYNFDKIQIQKDIFFKTLQNFTNIDKNHTTFPVIFHGSKFIGGYTDLKKILNKK